MTIDRQYTPIPRTTLSPIQVIASDHIALPAHSTKTMLNVRDMGNQVMDIREIGGRPEDELNISVEAKNRTSGGTSTEETEVEASALDGLSDPIETGPVANTGLTWSIKNGGSTGYNSSNNNIYQSFINYVVRRMSIAEKIYNGIPVNDRENSLADRYNISDRVNLNVPIRDNDLNKPNLKEKDIISRETAATTIDITDTGDNSPFEVVSENSLMSRGVVAYATGLEVNGQEFSADDDIKIQFVRSGTDRFYRVDTYSVPGNNNDYKADLHVPFLNNMLVNAFASSQVSSVDVKLEYVLVRRNLVEKALHGLESEIISNDDMADARFDIYNKLRERMEVGIEIDTVLDNISFSNSNEANTG